MFSGFALQFRLATAVLLLLSAAGCGGLAEETSQAGPLAPSTTARVHPKAEPIPVPQDLVFLQDNQIRVLDVTGWKRKLVTSGAALGAPAWSHDGERVVYDAAGRLWIKGTRDNWKPMPLHRCDRACVSVRDAAWSPDGKMIAFAVTESKDDVHASETSIKVFNLDKAVATKIYTDSAPTHRTVRPRWSPDGSALVFEQDTVDSNRLDAKKVISSRLLVAGVKRKKEKPQVVADAGPTGSPRSPDWGKRGIVFSRAGNLFAVIPNGGPAQQLTSFDGTTEQALEPTWSPAGGRIVFTYVSQAPGGVVHRMAGLVTAKGRGFHPLLRTEGASRPSLAP